MLWQNCQTEGIFHLSLTHTMIRLKDTRRSCLGEMADEEEGARESSHGFAGQNCDCLGE